MSLSSVCCSKEIGCVVGKEMNKDLLVKAVS